MTTLKVIGGFVVGAVVGGGLGIPVGFGMDEPGTDWPGMALLFTVPLGALAGAAVGTGIATQL